MQENMYFRLPIYKFLAPLWEKNVMALYESTFIVRQDVSSQEVDKIAEEFSAIVKEGKGKVVKKEYWGLRNLAYKINKGRKGHYVMLGIDADATTVNELSRKYKISEDIIRSLTIKVEEISKDPSAIMNNDAKGANKNKKAGGYK